MGEGLDALLDIPGQPITVYEIVYASKREIRVIREPGAGEHEPGEKSKHNDDSSKEPFPRILFFAGRYFCLVFLFRLQITLYNPPL
jgi:hypothetical protein